MNKVILIGNLTNEPKRTVISKKEKTSVCKFGLATNGFKNADGEQTVEFHNITVFNKLSDICNEHLNKGDKVAITGRIQYSKYEDKEGNTKYFTEIIADEVEFLGSKKQED